MWLTHAPSGESSGRKMGAGLNPECQPTPGQPLQEGHAQPQVQLQAPCWHLSGLARPQVRVQLCPRFRVPLSPKSPLAHGWVFSSQGGQVWLEAREEKRAPRPSDTSMAYFVSAEALVPSPPASQTLPPEPPPQTCQHQQAAAHLQPQTWPKNNGKFTRNFQCLWA